MDFDQTNLLLEQYINGTLQKYDLLFCLFGSDGREVPPQERSRFLLEYLHRVTETQDGGAEYAVILHEVLSCKDPQTSEMGGRLKNLLRRFFRRPFAAGARAAAQIWWITSFLPL